MTIFLLHRTIRKMKLECIVSDNCDLLYLLRKYRLIKFLKFQYPGTNSFQFYLRYRLRKTGGFSFSIISLALSC